MVKGRQGERVRSAICIPQRPFSVSIKKHYLFRVVELYLYLVFAVELFVSDSTLEELSSDIRGNTGIYFYLSILHLPVSLLKRDSFTQNIEKKIELFFVLEEWSERG